MKITIIGGGNIGSAIAEGAVKASVVNPQDITITDPSPAINQYFREFNSLINLCQDNAKAIIGADMIIVAVKPWLIESVLEQICNTIDRDKQIVVSIAAGISFGQLNEYSNSQQLGNIALYRVIPNTAIALGESTTFICKQNSSPEQDTMIISLLNALGKTFVVEESQMAAMTSLASCGIAYAYKYIDASIKGGIKMGVDKEIAREIVMQTVTGALKMLNANNNPPQVEIDKVTTPGGLTLKGLEEMDRCEFTSAVVNGLLASNIII